MKHLRSAALLILVLLFPWALLAAQAIAMYGAADIPKLEFGAKNDDDFHANAPPRPLRLFHAQWRQCNRGATT